MPEPIKIKIPAGIKGTQNLYNVVRIPDTSEKYVRPLPAGTYYSADGVSIMLRNENTGDGNWGTQVEIDIRMIKRIDFYKNIIKEIGKYFNMEDDFVEYYCEPWRTYTDWYNAPCDFHTNALQIDDVKNCGDSYEITLAYVRWSKSGLRITVSCAIENESYGTPSINVYVSAKGLDGVFVRDGQYFFCPVLSGDMRGYTNSIGIDDGDANGSVTLKDDTIAFYMIDNGFAYSLFDGIRNDDTTILSISGMSFKGDKFWVSMMSNATSSTSATMISTIWSKSQAINGMKVYCCCEDVCNTSVDGTNILIPFVPTSALPLFRIFCYSPSNGLIGKLNAYDTLRIDFTDGENYVQEPASIGLGWFFPLGFNRPILGATSDKESYPTTISYLITLGG